MRRNPQGKVITLMFFNKGTSLENLLRSFACLTKGDMLAIKYNKKVFFFYIYIYKGISFFYIKV